jgi:hypothetical protein
MAATPGTPSRFVRAEIEEALAHGSTFATIERDIVEQARVSEDARAALWLFAWGSAERRDRGLSPTRPAVARARHPSGRF